MLGSFPCAPEERCGSVTTLGVRPPSPMAGPPTTPTIHYHDLEEVPLPSPPPSAEMVQSLQLRILCFSTAGCGRTQLLRCRIQLSSLTSGRSGGGFQGRRPCPVHSPIRRPASPSSRHWPSHSTTKRWPPTPRRASAPGCPRSSRRPRRWIPPTTAPCPPPVLPSSSSDLRWAHLRARTQQNGTQQKLGDY